MTARTENKSEAKDEEQSDGEDMAVSDVSDEQADWDCDEEDTNSVKEKSDVTNTADGHQSILANVEMKKAELSYMEVVECLIILTECANVEDNKLSPNVWSDNCRSLDDIEVMPQNIRMSMMALRDQSTGKLLSEIWTTTWTDMLQYSYGEWQLTQGYQQTAKQSCSKLWVCFAKAYNNDPMPLATTLTLTLYCTRRFLALNLYMTMTTKIISRGKIRVIENQIKWTSQARDSKMAYKRPTKYQLQARDRGGSLLDRATKHLDE